MVTSKTAVRWTLAVLVLILLVGALPIRAQEVLCQDGIDNDSDGLIDIADTDCQCLEDATGISGCTANDVSFVLIGLGTQLDGCVFPTDTLDIKLGASLQTTAATRYDLGMWVALDGGSALRAGPEIGLCTRQVLTPVSAGAPDPSNPAGTGPFVDSDGDSCGELRKADPDAVYQFPYATQFPCADSDANGFVDISTCFSDDNNSQGTCNDIRDAIPGTSSKCGCQDLQTNVPVPNLGLTCSCSPDTIGQGEATTCTITYNNAIDCVPDLATAERFRCGTGSYLRFETEYDETRGSVSSISQTNTAPGTVGTTSDDGSKITWIPRNQIASGSLGIIGDNQSESMSFTYTADPMVTNGTATITTNTYWSNSAADDPSAILQGALTCSFDITTIPVTVAWADARREGNRAVLEWTTATETANAGFNVWARHGNEWHRLTAEPIPSKAISSTEPQSYRFETDEIADAYRVEDVALDGQRRSHQSMALDTSVGERPVPDRIDWQAVRTRTEEALRPSHAAGVRHMAAAAKAGHGPAAVPAVELSVDTTGLQRVTFEDLAAAGFDFSGVKGADLALSRAGQPVPLRVEAGRAGKLGPGSFLEFWGEAADTLYTGTNVYLLREDKKAAVAPAVDDTAPAGTAPGWYVETRRTERDRTYSVNAPGPDPWVDTQLVVFGSPRTYTFPLEVDDLAAAPGAPQRLAVELWGMTDWDSIAPDHHVRLSVNGTPVADRTFDGPIEQTLSVDLPPGLLVEGANQLTIEMPADTGAASDAVLLEAWTLTWPRASEARDGALVLSAAGGSVAVSGLPDADVEVWRLGDAPVRLTGAQVAADGAGYAVTFPGTATPSTYAVVSAAARRSPALAAHREVPDLFAGDAQWLAIVHPAFLDEIAPLAAARAAQGYSVDVVNVEDIYAAYSGGNVDAGAIHDYIVDAAARRGTEMVLLVGGDTYDYRDHLGLGSVSFIPSLYAATGTFVRHAPADPLYGDLTGDDVPEIAVGRLPVRTPEELATVVDKILTYDVKPYGHTIVAAADKFDTSNSLSFTNSSDSFLGYLDPTGHNWTKQRAYLDSLSVDLARQRIVGGIDSGAALTTFVGHSGLTAWTFSGLFRTVDAEALDNPGQPTVVLQWGCWNTYYVQPSYNTLGHKLLLSGDRGAAAVLGASTLVKHTSVDALAHALAPLLATPGTPLGQAIVQAKRTIASSSQQRADVLVGWTLLGDPATEVVTE